METDGLWAGPSSFLRRSTALELKLQPKATLPGKADLRTTAKELGRGLWMGLLQGPCLSTQSTLGSLAAVMPSGMQCSLYMGSWGASIPW